MVGRGLVVTLAVALAFFAGSAQTAGTLTRPRAVAAALKLLEPQREPGLNGRVTVFMTARPVPAGATISEGVTHRRLVVLRKAAWLVWEDLGHIVLFPHASKLLLLDAAGGKSVLLRPLVFFPLVNGKPPAFFGSSAAYLGERGAIYRRALPSSASARNLAGRGTGSDLSGDGLVTAGARNDPAFSNDFKQIEKTADDLKLDKERAEPTEQGIVDAIGKLTKKGKKDIFLFVGGHGYPKSDKYYTDKDGKQQLSQPGSKSPQLILDDKAKGIMPLLQLEADKKEVKP